MFPLLATTMNVSKLQQDHEEMDVIIHDIEQACRSAEGGILSSSLERLRALVLPHMALEEDLITPANLEAAGFTRAEIAAGLPM